MIKAVFFDIDGTLVSFKTHRVPPSTVQALERLRARGIKLFIATGRHHADLNNLGGLAFDGYITLNGQYCYDDRGVIYQNCIRKISERLSTCSPATRSAACSSKSTGCTSTGSTTR